VRLTPACAYAARLPSGKKEITRHSCVRYRYEVPGRARPVSQPFHHASFGRAATHDKLNDYLNGMGCGSSLPITYTFEMAQGEMAMQTPMLPKVVSAGDNISVLEGCGWLFNPASPIDPVLARLLDGLLTPTGLTWTQAVTTINDAVAQAHVGLSRAFKPTDIPERRAIAKEGALRGMATLNERLKQAGASNVSFVSEEGMPTSQITQINGRKRGGRGVRTTTVHTQTTSIYLVVDNGEAAVAPMATAEAMPMVLQGGAMVLQGAPVLDPAQRLTELHKML